jgi:hypothetical protein
MPDADLRLATREELVHSLAFALCHDGRKSYRTANEFIANIAAHHLAAFLERSGYVVMKKPPIGGHSIDRVLPREG